MARFSNGKAPFIRLSDTNKDTATIMRDFLIGMSLVILFSWFKNGILVYINGDATFLEMLYPLVFILTGGFLSILMEAVFFYKTDPEANNLKGIVKRLKTSYAVFPGFILALLLPLYTPIWVLMVGVFFATIVGKMLFGGFGYNLFNPAIIGRVVVMASLMGLVMSNGGFLNPSEVIIDAAAGATPLAVLAETHQISYQVLVAPYGSLWNFFLGTIPGSLGETSALVIIIAYLWFSFRKVIKWTTPLIYIVTVFVLTWIIGAVNGETGLWFPVYGILSGGLMYGAVFMSTEPVTTPRNPLGKVFNALFLGALTVLFRYIGTFPEGVATAIIVMNIFLMPLDKTTAVIRSSGLNKKTWGKFALLVFILVAIMAYGVYKSIDMYSAMTFFVGGNF
ncbi:MAG: RnfABCDGE type electron transport complex subunit D [Candidatus Izemoplasmatales bacterium]